MTSRRRRACTAVLALVLAGCSTGGEQGTAPGDSAAGTARGLEVAGVWTGEEQDRFQEVLDAFAARTGTPVTYTSLGDDAAAVLAARVDLGRPPDLAVLPQPGLLQVLARQGLLVPLDPPVQAAVREHYDPVWDELGRVDGVLFGVWFKAANKSTLWYRPSALAAAGVQPPRTWDELVAVGDALARTGVPAFSVAGGDGWTLTDWFENVYLRVAGPDRYDQLTRHEIPWTDPTVTESLRVLHQVWGRAGFVEGGARGALRTSFPSSVSRVFSTAPSAAMVYEGDFVAGMLPGGADADVVAFPAVAGSPPSVVGGGDVTVQFRDDAPADRLLEYLASPESAAVWAARGGFTSPNRDLPLDTYPDDVTRASAAALIAAGDNFRFDMSDLGPTAFSGTPGQGQWRILQEFLLTGDVEATAVALERAASAAYPSTAAG